MARIFNFAEFQITRREDTHGWNFSMGSGRDKDCPHLHLLFDENGHTVECKDCGREVSAWWAFMSLVERFQHEEERIELARVNALRAEQRVLTHKAAIAVEDAWRRHKYVPTCPHCGKPILPQDNFGSGNCMKTGKEGSLPLKMVPVLALIKKDELA
jgi:hypothetical protein